MGAAVGQAPAAHQGRIGRNLNKNSSDTYTKRHSVGSIKGLKTQAAKVQHKLVGWGEFQSALTGNVNMDILVSNAYHALARHDGMNTTASGREKEGDSPVLIGEMSTAGLESPSNVANIVFFCEFWYCWWLGAVVGGVSDSSEMKQSLGRRGSRLDGAKFGVAP